MATGVLEGAQHSVVTADDPVFVTTCVYVMLFPACTGFGEAAFVTERFGPVVPTIVLAVAVLLAVLVSLAALTVTVLDSVPVAEALAMAVTV